MREKEERELDIQYLKTMIYYAEQVKERLLFAQNHNLSVNDDMVIESVALLLGQIGEQLDSKKLSPELQQKYQGNPIDFSSISKFRNKAYHHYGSMNSKGILKAAMGMDELIEQINYIIRKERLMHDF
ncbi:hypothetical protein [Lactococcus lactis]|uniref:hypothetical protein n=1 Tax=Lactococcus lactis TaxID=1358 RepID=UPI001911864E|nr:hypothetical protein [Lactococcus lactis]WDA68455.1 hypothetical protein IL310_13145 [Lactococcus lactis]